MAGSVSLNALRPASAPRFPIAAKGFRPFFLLAAALAAVLVPLWLAVLTGYVSASPYFDPVRWHAHEMLFGFTVAVIAGFLLTAVGNWTQRETLVGSPLLALSGLWALGRLAMLLPGQLPRGLPAVIDLAFLPLLIVALARPLIAAKSRRNFVMLGVLTALFAANLAMHLDALGVLPSGSARRASAVALDVVLVVVLVIAGRVIPMFTRNATNASTIRSSRALDIAAVLGMVALAALDAATANLRLLGAVAAIVGLLAVARAIHWGAQHSLRDPLLWILHTGYAWLVLGLLLRGVAGWSAVVPGSSATHALTVGAIGSLTLGMMSRVALGHTGRLLMLPRPMLWAFIAINGAAVARVIIPIALPSAYLASLLVAGALWAAAFVAFLVVYQPILTGPRVDGKAG